MLYINGNLSAIHQRVIGNKEKKNQRIGERGNRR